MRKLINLAVSSVVIGIGTEFGAWLWRESLKDKFVEFKEYLDERKQMREVEAE